MVKLGFAAANGVVDLTIAEDFLALHPGANRPAGQGHTIPGRPTALCLLIRFTYSGCLIQINEHEVRIIANFDPPFADEIPHPRWRVAHPADDLLDAAAPTVNFV